MFVWSCFFLFRFLLRPIFWWLLLQFIFHISFFHFVVFISDVLLVLFACLLLLAYLSLHYVYDENVFFFLFWLTKWMKKDDGSFFNSNVHIIHTHTHTHTPFPTLMYYNIPHFTMHHTIYPYFCCLHSKQLIDEWTNGLEQTLIKSDDTFLALISLTIRHWR